MVPQSYPGGPMEGQPRSFLPEHPLFGLGYTQPVVARAFDRIDGQRTARAEAAVAEEVPVALVYNARPHVVMMATPADLEDFAVGFSLTEEIVDRAEQIGR